MKYWQQLRRSKIIGMENTTEILIKAIKLKKPVEFEYNRPGKIFGKRVGNPHIVFAGTTKEGNRRTWVHIAQTGGVSDTLKKFPDWRIFIMEFITNVRILSDEPVFESQEGYNPNSDMYTETIAKV